MKNLESIFRTVLVLGCIAIAPVCAEEQMSILLDQETYALGDTAEVVIANYTDDTALFTLLCDLSWEGRAGDEWETVFEPDCSNVRVRPTRLPEGEDMVTEIVVAPCDTKVLKRYQAFRARIRFQLESAGEYVTTYSQEVSIASP